MNCTCQEAIQAHLDNELLPAQRGPQDEVPQEAGLGPASQVPAQVALAVLQLGPAEVVHAAPGLRRRPQHQCGAACGLRHTAGALRVQHQDCTCSAAARPHRDSTRCPRTAQAGSGCGVLPLECVAWSVSCVGLVLQL